MDLTTQSYPHSQGIQKRKGEMFPVFLPGGTLF